MAGYDCGTRLTGSGYVSRSTQFWLVIPVDSVSSRIIWVCQLVRQLCMSCQFQTSARSSLSYG